MPPPEKLNKLWNQRSSDTAAPILCAVCDGLISFGSPCPTEKIKGKSVSIASHTVPHAHFGKQDCKHHTIGD